VYGNRIYYYHFDGLGSVVALSNENKEIVEQYSYDVFGEPNTAGTIGNPYLFTGRRHDNETALYYYRARYYDYYTGRFIQADPIFAVNLYHYCENNPINFVDPYGLCKEDAEKRGKYQQLQDYIKSAEATMIANIHTLELLHGEVKSLHEHYKVVLIADTGLAALTWSKFAIKTASGVALYKSASIRGGLDWGQRLAGERKILAAIREVEPSLIAGGISLLPFSTLDYIDIAKARRRAISKYDPLIEQTLTNIETLAKAVSIARMEMASLDRLFRSCRRYL